jgi:hypothetical protein
MVFTGPKGLGRVLSSKQWVLRKMLKVLPPVVEIWDAD